MFLKHLIVRTPSFPFNDDISEEFLIKLLDNAKFIEALYLASPVLYQEAINWKEGKITDSKKLQKIPISLGKYYLRMCSRCTPFGLFAGCGVVEWGGYYYAWRSGVGGRCYDTVWRGAGLASWAYHLWNCAITTTNTYLLDGVADTP